MSDDSTHLPDPANAEDDGERERRLLARLDALRAEHRRLDTEIDAARETGMVDMLKIQRMKKVKLAMKDQIAWLEDELTPDIIA